MPSAPNGPPLDLVPALIWSATADGAAVFFNRPWLDYVGMPIEAVRGWGWTEALHPEDRARVAETWTSIVASAQAGQLEGRLRRHDGAYRWFLFRAAPVCDPDGTVREWVGTNADIDDVKRVETALQRRERELRTLIESIPGLIAAADADGRQDYANRRLLEFVGMEASATADRGWLQVIHPDERDAVAAAWVRATASGEPYEVLHRVRRHDGAYRWFHARGEPLYDEKGAILRWYALLTDVHDLRLTEEALRRSQAELAHVTRITTIGELSTSIVHEVNQPLAAIVNNASACLALLPEGDPDVTPVCDALRDILQDAERAGGVIARMRQWARKSVLEPAALRLADVVRDVLEFTRHEAAAHRATVRVDFDADVPVVAGDRVQLQQVVVNLVLNGFEAMEHVPEPERLLMIRGRRASDATPAALLCVEDAGAGLGNAAPERCFEAFYTTKPRGMGMGLTISRSIVSAHGGSLWAEPRRPGAAFLVRLPAAAL